MDTWRELELYLCSTDAQKVAPGQIPHHVATQFLHRYKRSDPRCNTDEPYCETYKVSCMVTMLSAKAIFIYQSNLRSCLIIYDRYLIMFVSLIVVKRPLENGHSYKLHNNYGDGSQNLGQYAWHLWFWFFVFEFL